MSFGKGGIGGIIGSILGTVLAPEIGIPAALATGAGGFLGQTAQGLESGKGLGKSLLGGAEAGALSGGLTALGDVIGGVPLSSSASPLSAIFGGGGGGADAGVGIGTGVVGGGADTGAALTAGASPAATAAASPAALTAGPASGAGFGGDPGSLSASVGVGGAPPISQIAGEAGPIGENFLGAITSAPGDNSASALNAAEFSQLTSPSPSPAATGTSLIPSSGAGVGTPFSTEGQFFLPGTDTPIPGGAGTPSGTVDTGGGGFGNDIINMIKANPGLLLNTGLAGASLLKGNGGPYPAEKSLGQNASLLNANAAGLTGQATQNLDALTTGRLPPGAQSALDSARSSGQAHVRSTFANLGLTGSSMESSALAQVDQQVEAQKFKMIDDLVRTGITESGLALQNTGAANNVYTTLLNEEIAKDKATQDALARFAGALAGGSGVRPAA